MKGNCHEHNPSKSKTIACMYQYTLSELLVGWFSFGNPLPHTSDCRVINTVVFGDFKMVVGACIDDNVRLT